MMKKIQLITTILTAALIILSSCTGEGEQSVTDQERDVIITIAPQTRAGQANVGDIKDREIKTLRVLGYRKTDGTLAFNQKITIATGSVTDKYNGRINVRTGAFTMIFIANEVSDAALVTLLNGITTTTNNTIGYLEQNANFQYTAFNSGRYIPMVNVETGVVIQGDDKVILRGAVMPNPWGVTLERIGIRLDVELTLPTEGPAGQDYCSRWENAGGKKIYFKNVPRKAYLFRGSDNSGDLLDYSNVSYTFSGTPVVAGDGKTKTYKFGRIILPELYAANLAQGKALTMKMYVGPTTNELYARIGIVKSTEATMGYTLPRNLFLDVKSTIKESDIGFVANVGDWDLVNLNGELL